MGKLCFGSGGTIFPPDYVPDADIPDLYLDWSKDYPGSEPPPVGQVPPGDPPVLGDQPEVGTDLDLWARGVLAQALYDETGMVPSPEALQVLQAVSRFESNYGWPFFPNGVSPTTGRDGRNWWGHHNWAAIQCMTEVGGRAVSCYHNGGCLAGFYDLGRVREAGVWTQYPSCFAHEDSNEAGARAFVRRVLGPSPARTMSVLDTGDLSLVATDLRLRELFVRTRDADDAGILEDAQWYAARLLANAAPIARLYGGTRVRPGSLGGDLVIDAAEPPGLSDLPAARATMGVGGVLIGLVVGAGLGLGAVWTYKQIRGW